jgi:hypothetical protein
MNEREMEMEAAELRDVMRASDEIRPQHDFHGAALAAHDETIEALLAAHIALTARVQRDEQLLLVALTALDNHLLRQHGFGNEDVSSAVELLREALGREP